MNEAAAADLVAIQQTLNRYSVAAGSADWNAMLATFAPDGVWEVTGLKRRFTGHAEIRAAIDLFMKPLDYFVQINAPAVITVDGDRATARSAIRETGKLAGRDATLDVIGFYDDELIRSADGWQFTRRAFTAIGKHQFALLT